MVQSLGCGLAESGIPVLPAVTFWVSPLPSAQLLTVRGTVWERSRNVCLNRGGRGAREEGSCQPCSCLCPFFWASLDIFDLGIPLLHVDGI